MQILLLKLETLANGVMSSDHRGSVPPAFFLWGDFNWPGQAYACQIILDVQLH